MHAIVGKFEFAETGDANTGNVTSAERIRHAPATIEGREANRNIMSAQDFICGGFCRRDIVRGLKLKSGTPAGEEGVESIGLTLFKDPTDYRI